MSYQIVHFYTFVLNFYFYYKKYMTEFNIKTLRRKEK